MKYIGEREEDHFLFVLTFFPEKNKPKQEVEETEAVTPPTNPKVKKFTKRLKKMFKNVKNMFSQAFSLSFFFHFWRSQKKKSKKRQCVD